MATALLSGSFTGTGASSSVAMHGCFNLSLSGFGTATVSAERSFDNGSTWVTVESFSADTEKLGKEPETKMLWRLNCTAYTSGTINYRISR